MLTLIRVIIKLTSLWVIILDNCFSQLLLWNLFVLKNKRNLPKEFLWKNLVKMQEVDLQITRLLQLFPLILKCCQVQTLPWKISENYREAFFLFFSILCNVYINIAISDVRSYGVKSKNLEVRLFLEISKTMVVILQLSQTETKCKTFY